jgi:hypothetical protein
VNTRSTLVLAGGVHRRLQEHLFPGDGKEAAAILLCTRMPLQEPKLLVKDVVLVPYEACHRFENRLVWSGACLEDAIDRSEQDDLSMILLHSHPGGQYEFSTADDASDQLVMPSLFMARDCNRSGKIMHGSAIMVPGGAVRARLYDQHLIPTPIMLVAVYGDSLCFYWNSDTQPSKRPMAFSDAMRHEMSKLRFLLVGASGTGSITGQQLARMGAGELTAVDHDRMERRNLNRILGSTLQDALDETPKVAVFEREVARFAPETRVIPVPLSIATREAVLEAARADIIFCCVDSDEGRSVCDRMAESFLQPLFDVGVVIPVRTTEDGGKAILDIHGRVDYVQPGGSSLEDRDVYSPESLAAEYLAKTDPEAFANRVKEGYMPGSVEQAPSVITVNMRAASACVQEFIARAYPYRLANNRDYARVTFSLAAGEEEAQSEDAFSTDPKTRFAEGVSTPLLGLPALEAQME